MIDDGRSDTEALLVSPAWFMRAAMLLTLTPAGARGPRAAVLGPRTRDPSDDELRCSPDGALLRYSSLGTAESGDAGADSSVLAEGECVEKSSS